MSRWEEVGARVLAWPLFRNDAGCSGNYDGDTLVAPRHASIRLG